MATGLKSKSVSKRATKSRVRPVLRKPRRTALARKKAAPSRKVPARSRRDRRLAVATGVGLAALALGIALFMIPRRVTVSQSPPSLRQEPASESAFLDQALSELSGRTVAERLVHWSMVLGQDAGLATRLAALSNAPSIEDHAPLVPKSFDCTTFVETVAALARSTTSAEFFSRVIEIRYKGSRPTFFERNHFPEADWLPNNQRNGILLDQTERIAAESGIEVRTESKTIDRGRWFDRGMRKGAFRGLASSEAPASWKAPVAVSVKYLPLSELDRYIERLPSGAVVNFVRGSTPNQPVLITHQGILFRSGGITYIRHSKHDGRIRTVELKKYVRSHDGISWPLIGLNILSING
jgi:hypothetical protein